MLLQPCTSLRSLDPCCTICRLRLVSPRCRGLVAVPLSGIPSFSVSMLLLELSAEGCQLLLESRQEPCPCRLGLLCTLMGSPGTCAAAPEAYQPHGLAISRLGSGAAAAKTQQQERLRRKQAIPLTPSTSAQINSRRLRSPSAIRPTSGGLAPGTAAAGAACAVNRSSTRLHNSRLTNLLLLLSCF